MRGSVWTAMISVTLAATGCASSTQQIGGRVRGMWQGADGVALRLQASGIDTLLVVTADGEIRYAQQLPEGTSYAVTVVASPAMHACAVDTSGNGMVHSVAVDTISIACTGPAVSVGFSGEPGWILDPTEDSQTFDASIFTKDVAVTVDGPSLLDAHVDRAALQPGEPSAPLALPIGARDAELALTASGGLSKTYRLTFNRGGGPPEQRNYAKPSNTGAGYDFGHAVALDRDTLVVGAPKETVIGLDGVTPVPSAGAVHVFARSGDTWTEQARLTAANPGGALGFGRSVAVSGDTLAIGSPDSDSVCVFVRTDTSWTQQTCVTGSNTEHADTFGHTVALSGDTLAVGAPFEASGVSGVDPPDGQIDNWSPDAGAVYVFGRVGATWHQDAYVKASNAGGQSKFGLAIALSEDTLAVGAPFEASAAKGIDGSQSDDSAWEAGAVYVFSRIGITWHQVAYVKASNTTSKSRFGTSVALSGVTMAIGAIGEASVGHGVNGSQYGGGGSSGAVYVFGQSGAGWAQQAYFKASNPEDGDQFGASLALAGDLLAVGAIGEASRTTDQADNQAPGAGAAYLFNRGGGDWRDVGYVKAANAEAGAQLGAAIALSADELVVAAPGEASAATGVDPAGSKPAGSKPKSGAFYVFR